MKSLALFTTAVALLTAGACADAGPVAPAVDVHRADHGPRTIGVMTQNLYVGADVDAVIAALASPDPNDDLPALLGAIETLGNTDFPSRAAAIAAKIARGRPHVVGLQEVSEIAIDLTGIGVPVQVQLDFLPILDTALAMHGLSYAVAASVKNIDATPFPGIRLVDYDVMLVDANRVTVTGAGGQLFANNLGPVAPGVVLQRGWIQTDAIVDGEKYQFVSTHLEAGFQPGLAELRAAQAMEIVTALGDSAPVVLMGDLNDLPGSPMHAVLLAAGFTDVWTALRGDAPGYTCCHRTDLSNQVAQFDLREDYVFALGFDGVRGSIDRFGLLPTDRVDGPSYPIWPSDHAGVLATLVVTHAP